MAMDNAKKTGLVVALGMPPPNKLKKAMSMAKDEGESDQEAQDEADSGGGGGEMALGTMWDALKSGDKTAAWDAFCDAMQIAKGKADDAGSEGDQYGGE
jgi:hypothetical protein